MKFGILATWSLLLGGPWVVAADDLIDFSDGFERLAALGMPDMEGAEWVEVPDPMMGGGTFGNYQLRQIDADLKGGGWKLRSGQFVGIGSTSPQTFPGNGAAGSGGVGGMLSRIAGRLMNPKPAAEGGEEPPRSLLERDVNELIEALGPSGPQDELSSLFGYQAATFAGPLLVFAAQIHHAGQPEMANRLARVVLERAPDRAVVIDGAVSVMADARYRELADQFFEDHDWGAYLEGLETLIEDFPRGWDGRLAIATLLEPVRARAQDAPVPEVALDGIELPERGCEWVARWTEPSTAEVDVDQLELPEGMQLSDYPPELRSQILASFRGGAGGSWAHDQRLWTLGAGAEGGATDDPIHAIKTLRMDGVIVLAALIGDGTLTHQPNPFSSTSSYYSSSESLAEKIRRILGSMQRPLSRGEIAERLLQAVVPQPGGERFGGETDPQLLREQAINFWKTHRESPPVELAAAYIAEGNGAQRQAAAEFLAGQEGERASAAFEKVVLEVSQPLEMLNPVSTYLQARKASARSFHESYTGLLRERYGSMAEEQLRRIDGGYQLIHQGGLDGVIQRLDVLVGARSVEALIADAVEAGGAGAWRQLVGSLQSTPTAELLGPFAKTIPDVESEAAGELLAVFMQVSQRSMLTGEWPAAAKAAWRPLLADARELRPSGLSQWFGALDLATLGQAAALTVELARNPEAYQQLQVQQVIGGESLGDLLVRRGKAFLAGETPPAFVTSDGVSDARRKEIAALAEDTSAAEYRREVLALTPPERAAWYEWFMEFQEGRRPVPGVLTELSNRVVEIPSAAEMNELFGVEVDRELVPEDLERIAKAALGDAEKWSGLHFSAVPASMMLGLKITAEKPGQEPWFIQLANDPVVRENEAEAYAAAFVFHPGLAVIWGLQDGEITALSPQQDGQFPAFAQYETLRESRSFMPVTLHVVVLTAEDLSEYRRDGSDFLLPVR